MTQLNESSLSRVWQHFNDPDRSVALLTAFRGEFDHAENEQRNRDLAAQIRQLGYGFFYVDGFWVENPGTDREQKVKEDSLFVTAPAGDRDFAKRIHRLGNQFQQDGVLIKDSSGVHIIFQDGSVETKERLSIGSLGDAYTRLRNNRKANTFTFVEERDDVGFIARLAGLKPQRNG
jgi:hypothetical protein